MLKKIKHKKVKKPENIVNSKRARKLKDKIKEYNVELEELQKEIDELMHRKLEIRVLINKLEFNLESI